MHDPLYFVLKHRTMHYTYTHYSIKMVEMWFKEGHVILSQEACYMYGTFHLWANNMQGFCVEMPTCTCTCLQADHRVNVATFIPQDSNGFPYCQPHIKVRLWSTKAMCIWSIICHSISVIN